MDWKVVEDFKLSYFQGHEEWKLKVWAPKLSHICFGDEELKKEPKSRVAQKPSKIQEEPSHAGKNNHFFLLSIYFVICVVQNQVFQVLLKMTFQFHLELKWLKLRNEAPEVTMEAKRAKLEGWNFVKFTA